MPASLPVIAGPLAQATSAPAGTAHARASGRSAAPDFMERLEAALGELTGASPDASLAMQAPASTAAAAPLAEITEPETKAAGVPVTSAAPNPLSVLPGALTAPPADATPSTTTAKPDAGGAEPADASARPTGKPAASLGRAERAATESGSNKDAALIDPATPAGAAPLAPTPPATSTVPPTRANGAPTAAHPADTATDRAASGAPSPGDGPTRPDHGPAQGTAPQQQTPALPGAEASLAARSPAPAPSSAETATDPIKAASPAAQELLSAEVVARAMVEASQPAATPVGRAAPAVQAATEPSRTDIASPAQQLAAPMVALGSGPDQSRRMTVRLDPEELGAVQVRVDRPKDGPARVEITVERPETLSLLLRDQPQLRRALDQAGIPPEGRNVVFQVATPDPQPRNDAPLPDHRQNNSGQSTTGDGGALGEGYGGGGDGGGSGRSRPDGADGDGPLYRFTPSAAQRRLRDGLDITA